jgi:hypothetical protein
MTTRCDAHDDAGRRRKEITMTGMDVSRGSGLLKKLRRVVSGSFAALCLAAFAFCAGCASVPGAKLAKPDSKPEESVAGKLGIKPVAIRLTAAGTMIDFRYSVVDPEKSLPMFNRQTKTYLLDPTTGDKFAVPGNTKLGPLRSSSRKPVAGKEYFIFFENPGILKRGDKVAVVVGDMKIENLTIE